MYSPKLRLNFIQIISAIIICFLLIPILSIHPKNTIVTGISFQDEPEENIARTNVNVTLTDTNTVYQRTTDIFNPANELKMQRLFALAKLTTHGDILLQFDAEYLADVDPAWSENLSLFKDSAEVAYFKSYAAMQDIVNVNTSLLDITSTSFIIHEHNRTGETNIFFIEQRIIFRQTTAFLLVLPEPFQFGLNKLELGQLSDFHFQFEYVNFGENDRFVTEIVRLKAPGSAITSIPSTNGYSGILYLTEFPYDAQSVPQFERPFSNAPQDIFLSIELPKGQNEVSCRFDKVFSTNASGQDTHIEKRRNIVSFFFDHDAYLPHSITINSVTPFLEQFSITEYVSMAAGVIAALFTVLKAIPYMLGRRSMNRYKNSLVKAAQKNEWKRFDELEEDSRERFMNQKFSAAEYEEVTRVMRMLREENSQ